MSIASVAAQQNAATAAASASSSNSALSSLDGNFSDFLNMLMTQLQNQDPTSPMDTDTFTSELVQFSSVEQQIQTNSSLTSLIQLTQGSEVIQGSSMIGKQVTVQSTQIPLQNGTGTVNFTAPAAEPVSIAITDSSGVAIYNTTVNATDGSNSWTWNGTNNTGQTEPDGLYTMSITAGKTSSGTSTLPFTVTGTATGVSTSTSSNSSSSSSSSSSSTTVDLDLGSLAVPFSSITSVANN